MTEWYVRPFAPDRRKQLVRIAALAAVLVAVGVGIAVVPALSRGSTATVIPLDTTVVTAQESGVFVHVVGAVNSPGMYELPGFSRVADAIDAAGGLTDVADSTSVNLARVVTDGEQVIIATRGESNAAAGTAGGKVNINRADATMLDTLPGIGPAIAGRIVDYRDANGPFTSIDAIDSVPGIGSALLDGLRDLVTL